MTVKEIYSWASRNMTFEPNTKIKSKWNTEIFNKFDWKKVANEIVQGQSKNTIDELVKLKKEYKKITDDIFFTVEDAWDRVKYYAKQELYDQNEDDYDDEEDVSDYDIDYHFDEAYFIDFMTQELQHNVIGQNKNWDKYMPDINLSEWNNRYQGLEEFINDTYIIPLYNEISDTINNLINKVNKATAEYEVNKPNMIKLAMGEDEYDISWKYL